MPPKKKKGRKKQKGRGIGSFVKDNKLISSGLSMIPHPAAQGLGWVAKQVGLGQQPQRGKGIFSDIGGGIGSIVHGFFG
jgi:hypothetical protein